MTDQTTTTELTELVAKALFEVDCARWGDSRHDTPQWNTDGTGYIAMAREAIAIIRQWDAGK